MKIYFRKTFKYDPCHSGLPKYESYEAVTRQIYSPEIIPPMTHESFNLPTFCSSLTRCVQTAKIISSGKITELDELREIKFSLHDMVSKEEFERYGSSLVRERFIRGFMNDSLLERKESMRKRVCKAIKLISQDNNDKLVVSHSFTMKIFEAYLKEGLDIFKNPDLISKVIFPETETYGFGKGFEVGINKL